MLIPRPIPKAPIPSHAQRVFKGEIFDVYQWKQQLFDGSFATFERLRRPDTVVVFPVLDDGRIMLLNQEQPGRPPFISAAGGRVEEGEDFLSAMKRELLEETGYSADEFVLWDAQQPTSKIDWAVMTFVAKGLHQTATPNLDPGEKISLKMVTFDELLGLADDERFSEREIVIKLLSARHSLEKLAELRRIFAPSTLSTK